MAVPQSTTLIYDMLSCSAYARWAARGTPIKYQGQTAPMKRSSDWQALACPKHLCTAASCLEGTLGQPLQSTGTFSTPAIYVLGAGWDKQCEGWSHAPTSPAHTPHRATSTAKIWTSSKRSDNCVKTEIHCKKFCQHPTL